MWCGPLDKVKRIKLRRRVSFIPRDVTTAAAVPRD